MENLSKERIQQIWDYELLSAWDEKGYGKMWEVVHKFMCKVKGKHRIGDVSFEDAEDYLVSLELKRCLDIDHTLGYHVFSAWRTDVIGFIHARSELLSMALIDNEPKPLLLLSIDDYKWKKKNARSSARFSVSKSYYKKVNQGNRTVKARELSKNHDWKTTK